MTSQNDSPDQIEQGSPSAPEGYIYAEIPMSSAQAQSAKAEARVRQTVKSAMQAYLAQFLDGNGPKRHLLEDAAPFAVQFETGISGAQDPDDPLVIGVQLARKWASLRKMFPAIIIIDTSCEVKSSGMGGLQQGRRIPKAGGDTEAIIVQTVMAKVGIQLMVGALGETDASDLCDVLRYILIELTVLTRGHVINPGKPSDRWEVRLPMTVGMEGLEQQTIADDSRDSFWSSSISLEVDFEGEIQHIIHHPADPGIFDTIANSGQSEGVTIDVPSEISMHDRPRVRVNFIPAWTSVVSDDRRVAVIDENYVIHPKRLGTFNILVLKDAPGDAQPVTLSSKSITVSPL